MNAIIGLGVTAFLSIVGRLFTQPFFESVLTKVVIFSSEKLAKMTSNTLDDDLVFEIKKRLAPESVDEKIFAALKRGDYVEAAKLSNERDGLK